MTSGIVRRDTTHNRADGICLAQDQAYAATGGAMQTDHRDTVQDDTESSLGALRPTDRRALRNWLRAAGSRGIDGIEDLGSRPWPDLRADAILGVYRTGRAHASWLIVGNADGWAVASLDDGAVSIRFATLAAALRSIRPSVTSGRTGPLQ